MLRSLDDASMLDRYIDIKAKISELQDELEELKPYLLDALMEEPNEKSAYRGFEFSIQRRKTYDYSNSVKDLESEIKEMKASERANGTAEISKHQAILVLKNLSR